MSTWADKFNALPGDVRRIGSAMDNLTRIQQLEMEKRRLKAAYQKSCREIDDHIKNCKN